MIVINVESSIQLTEALLNILIDNCKVTYEIKEQSILINKPVSFGFHTLKIKTNFIFDNTTDHIHIKDVLIDHASVRQMLYLSYCPSNDSRIYTTIINHKDSEWHLPFGNPVSWWLSECMRQIPNKAYGTDLNQSLEILYPESIDLPSSFPTIVRDFFQYNFGFTSYDIKEKTNPLHNPNIPYLPVDLEYDEESLFNEFVSNLEYLESEEYVPGQNQYNDYTDKKPWYIDLAIRDSKIKVDPEKFPEFCKLVQSIKGVDIKLSFIGTLYPNSYIAPHVDDLYKYVPGMENCKGLSQIFIPIGWKENNYFKAHNVGLLPYQQGALLFANSRIPHASVNCSDSLRFTIGLMCEFKGTDFLKYIKNREN